MRLLKKASILMSSFLFFTQPLTNSSSYATFKRKSVKSSQHRRISAPKHKKALTSRKAKKATYMKLFEIITTTSNSIICSTSLLDDFLKIPLLISLNNSLCCIFNIVCPTGTNGFVNFETIDFCDIDIPDIGYGSAKSEILTAMEQTKKALNLFCVRSEIVSKAGNVKQIKSLLQSIIAALDAILYPDKYYLGELSD